MIKLLIFDFDGTLADTAEGIASAVNQFFLKYNKPQMHLQEIKPHIGLGLKKLIEGIFAEMEVSFLDEPDMYQNFLKCYEQNYLLNLKAFEGAHEFLSEWPHEIAIASNKFEQFLGPCLRHMDLEKFRWSSIIGRDTLPVHKPNPLPLITCMNAVGAKPEETLMIGDGIPDIEAALAAGVQSIAVEFGYAPLSALKSAGANYTLKHFKDLFNLIEEINKTKK